MVAKKSTTKVSKATTSKTPPVQPAPPIIPEHRIMSQNIDRLVILVIILAAAFTLYTYFTGKFSKPKLTQEELTQINCQVRGDQVIALNNFDCSSVHPPLTVVDDSISPDSPLIFTNAQGEAINIPIHMWNENTQVTSDAGDTYSYVGDKAVVTDANYYVVPIIRTSTSAAGIYLQLVNQLGNTVTTVDSIRVSASSPDTTIESLSLANKVLTLTTMSGGKSAETLISIENYKLNVINGDQNSQ